MRRRRRRPRCRPIGRMRTGWRTGTSRRTPAAQTGSTMQDSFDITTLIFLALAVFVIWRLRSVLGQKTGSEQPPFDPLSRREPPGAAPRRAPEGDNVVRLPGADRASRPAAQAEPRPSAGRASPSPARASARGLDEIAARRAGLRSRGPSRRRQGRLRDDRDRLRARRPQDPQGPPVAGRLRRLRAGDRRARAARREGRDHLRLDRQGRDRRRRGAQPRRADHGALPVEAHHGDPRRRGQGRRWQPRDGGRRDRCLDLRAHARQPRSELAARRHRSRANERAPWRAVAPHRSRRRSHARRCWSSAPIRPRAAAETRFEPLGFRGSRRLGERRPCGRARGLPPELRAVAAGEPGLRPAQVADEGLVRACRGGAGARRGRPRRGRDGSSRPLRAGCGRPAGRPGFPDRLLRAGVPGLARTAATRSRRPLSPGPTISSPSPRARPFRASIRPPGRAAHRCRLRTLSGPRRHRGRRARERAPSRSCSCASPVEAFVIHVQGSARIRLPTAAWCGSPMRAATAIPTRRSAGSWSSRAASRLGEMSLERLGGWLEGPSRRSAGRDAPESLLHLLPPRREIAPRGRPHRRRGHSADAGPGLAVDRTVWSYGLPCGSRATLPRTEARTRAPAPADDRPGHRQRHRRPGARRLLLRLRPRGRHPCGPAAPRRAVRGAAAEPVRADDRGRRPRSLTPRNASCGPHVARGSRR